MRGSRFGLTKTSIVATTFLALICSAKPAICATGDTTADIVLGQADFAHSFPNLVDAKGLWAPSAVTVDSAGHVYVADAQNGRILGWSSIADLKNGAPADLLIGRASFYDASSACPAPTADNLCNPSGLATDSQGNLYVSDTGRSRILVFASPFAQCSGTPCIIGNAEAVIGQPDFTSGSVNQGGAPTAKSFYFPLGLAVDSSDDLFVADQQNNRVLEFKQPLTSANHCNNTFPCTDVTADVVYGQANFVSNSQTSGLNFPAGVWVDANSNVYVADYGNHRLVEYNSPSGDDPSPSTIFDLPDLHGGFDSLDPIAVAVDPTGNVYATDNLYQRIVEFNQPLTSPSHCNDTFPCTVQSVDATLGQTSTSSGCNQGASAPTANTLCRPAGLGVDSSGDLYVADSGNNRVLAYQSPLTSPAGCNGTFPCYDVAASLVLGQVDFIYSTANLVDGLGLDSPNSVAVDSSNHVYVADTFNSRILGWANAASLVNGAPADLVIGEPNFYSSVLPGGLSISGACPATASASTLCGPEGIAVDAAGNLYVADVEESRVLEYDTPFVGCKSFPCVGPPAHMIVGQNDTTGNKCNKDGSTLSIGPDTLCNPTGVAVDGSGNLYVADNENNRILEYNDPLATCGPGTCIIGNANLVFGQPDFTSFYCNRLKAPTAGTLCYPSALAIDSLGDLFVADTLNSRVLEYNQPLAKPKGRKGLGDTIADRVWGQNGSFTTSSCNLGGPNASPSATSLCYPGGVAVDSAFDVFISDNGNNRVLEYAHHGRRAGPSTADMSFGQPGFTTGKCNLALGAPSANSLCGPSGIWIDNAANLWVTDGGNSRVLEYSQPLGRLKK